MKGTRTDAAVIGESLQDPERFAAIFDRHYAAVHAFVTRRAGADVADEVASQAFVTAFESRSRFDLSHDSARPWILGIATNKLRRHRRSERRQIQAYGKVGVEVSMDFTADAENRVLAMTSAMRLAQALASISPKERDVLCLYAWADLSYDEIAVALGIPVGTVRSRLARARQRIREPLGADLSGRPGLTPSTRRAA